MHDLLNGINLTAESQTKTGFFLKIEELQLVTFLYICQKFEPDIVLDIGSNIGFYTLVSKKYFTDISFHCFEPTPSTFKQLFDNISLNSNPENSINMHNIALSNSEGKVDFLDFQNLSGKNGIHKTSIHNSNGADVIQVQSLPLDNMLETQDARILLKIDTEGHEEGVILGAQNLLKNNICIIQVETGHGAQNTSIIQRLENLGYSKMFTLGPDAYYTNGKFAIPSEARNLLSEACSKLIDYRWSGKFVFES